MLNDIESVKTMTYDVDLPKAKTSEEDIYTLRSILIHRRQAMFADLIGQSSNEEFNYPNETLDDTPDKGN